MAKLQPKQIVARVRLTALDKDRIEKTRSVREVATVLRDVVSRGSYTDDELQRFGELATSAGMRLQIANSELSERAGLGPNFFTTVGSRRPRLHNMLKALNTLIDVANERLADVEADQNGAAIGWITNPLLNDQQRLELLHQQLLDVVSYLKGANSFSDVPELDQHWRDTLIDILETILRMLRAPLVERSLLEKAGTMLKESAQKVTSDSSAGFFGGLAGVAALKLLEMLG
jgi:hypothetical protein